MPAICHVAIATAAMLHAPSCFCPPPPLPPQENDLLHKQNELLRSSEAAYQREAQLVSEERELRPGTTELHLSCQAGVEGCHHDCNGNRLSVGTRLVRAC